MIEQKPNEFSHMFVQEMNKKVIPALFPENCELLVSQLKQKRMVSELCASARNI